MRLEGVGHLNPSPGGIHTPSPGRFRGEQTSSQNWAEHFPSTGAPTGILRLLHHKTPIDWPFPRDIFPLFSSQSFPPRPCNFYLHYISLGEKFWKSGLWPVLSEGEWKGLFCPGEGLFVPAWKHGIIIIMGLIWRIKLVVAGRYTPMGFLAFGVKFRMNGTIYIFWVCWLCHFSALFTPHSWILGFSISSIWTCAGLALS